MMLSSKNKIITPLLCSRKTGRMLTPINIAIQRANVECCILTPEEEDERNKRIADIKKQKDAMTKLRKIKKWTMKLLGF